MSNVENVSPQALRAIMKEVQALAASPPPGIKLVLHDDDLTDIIALIDGPAESPYCGGTFRVRVSLGRDYPAAAPRAHFLTRVFHPNVCARDGAVCVDTLRRGWRPQLGLAHALAATRALLLQPNADSALNADAATLLRDDYSAYCRRAALLTRIHAAPTPAPAPSQSGGDGSGHSGAGGGGGDGGGTSGGGGGEDGDGGRAATVDGAPLAKRDRRAGGAGARAGRDRRRILKRL